MDRLLPIALYHPSTLETIIYTFLITNLGFNQEKYRRLFVLHIDRMRTGFETKFQVGEIDPLFVGCCYC